MLTLQSALLTMYGEHGLTSSDMPEIMNMVKAKHYHVACTRVFEITHARQGVKKGEGVGGRAWAGVCGARGGRVVGA